MDKTSRIEPRGGSLVQDYVKIVAWLYIALGALGSLGAVLIFGVFVFAGTMVWMTAQEDPQAFLAAPILWVVGAVLCAIILLFAVPGVVAGIGLLDFRPWARVVAIVISALHLFKHTCRDGARNIWALGPAQLRDGGNVSIC